MSGSTDRRVLAALSFAAVLLGCAGAQAADMPDLYEAPLRGTIAPVAPRVSWDGLYFGGQYGRSFTNADFGNSSSSQISYILANTELESIVSSWTTLPRGTTGTNSYGGFVGFSTHWDDIVGSLELNYNRIGSSVSSAGSVGPLIVSGATQTNGDTVQYSVTVASNAAVSMKDVMTFRGRVGWAVDRFLPYAFGGLAVGRADVARTTSVTGTKSVTTPAVLDALGNVIIPPITTTSGLNLPRNPQSASRSVIAYGFTAGLGIDVDLLANVFLRAEWEYTGFANIEDVRVNINAVRAGIGVRF